jgi:hypothetical protein
MPAGMSAAGWGALRWVNAVRGMARRVLPEGKRVLRRDAGAMRGRLVSDPRLPGARGDPVGGGSVSYVVGDGVGVRVGRRSALSLLGAELRLQLAFVLLGVVVCHGAHNTKEKRPSWAQARSPGFSTRG